MKLFDAHRHLLTGATTEVASVVNGTCPEDWDAVTEVAYPAIGLHPWKLAEAGPDWREHFLHILPKARAIGEMGLDGLCGVDMELQIEVFRWQLEQAAEHNLPVSIHCLKASEPLLGVLKEAERPQRGFHLHAYAGSAEQVRSFADLGAYFSFHAGQLVGTARKAPEAVKAVPTDRLLIETDAPETLKNGEAYDRYLRRGFDLAAGLRGESLESFCGQIADNFQKYFYDD